MNNDILSWFDLSEQEQKDEIERLEKSCDTIKYLDMPQDVIWEIVKKYYTAYLIENKEVLKQRYFDSLLWGYI